MTTSLGKRTVMSSFAFSGDLKLGLAALIVPITPAEDRGARGDIREARSVAVVGQAS
jgi:hypothetical protein